MPGGTGIPAPCRGIPRVPPAAQLPRVPPAMEGLGRGSGSRCRRSGAGGPEPGEGRVMPRPHWQPRGGEGSTACLSFPTGARLARTGRERGRLEMRGESTRG